MNITIVLGWWILPFIISVIFALIWGIVVVKDDLKSSGFGQGFMTIFATLCIFGIICFVWLVYFGVAYFIK